MLDLRIRVDPDLDPRSHEEVRQFVDPITRLCRGVKINVEQDALKLTLPSWFSLMARQSDILSMLTKHVEAHFGSVVRTDPTARTVHDVDATGDTDR